MSSALYKTLDLNGQVAIVTGASAGIGEAIAWRLAEAGCKLVLVARRAERLEALKDQLADRYKVPVLTVCLDMRDAAGVERMVLELPPEFAEVDILVNNAGLALGVAPVHENDMEDMRTMLDTNVASVMLLTKLVVAGMVQRNRGHVVMLSSIAAKEHYAGGSIYCATKAAIDAFTTATRHDLVGTDIRVTAISPGAVRTEFSVVRFKGDEGRADDVYKGIDPLTAADIADNVMYALTRPSHVQVADMLVLATYQCSAKGLARVKQAA